MTMKIGVIGHQGRIGKELVSLGCVPFPCDILSVKSIQDEYNKSKPDVLINCAGVSNVEEAQNDFLSARSLNVRGVYNICSVTVYSCTKVVCLSSDHVFSGKLIYPFKYKEWMKPNPVNSYGWTKLGMEALTEIFPHMRVLRTSYVMDTYRLAGVVKQITSGNPFPSDMIRSFISLKNVSESILYCANNVEKLPKFLHVAGTKSYSWYEMAKLISKSIGYKGQVLSRKYVEMDNVAPRPKRVPLSVGLALKLGVPLHEYEKDF